MGSPWNDVTWFVVFNGIADRWLWGFDADGWPLRHGDPAMGMLGILPMTPGGAGVSLEEALWLADALAFDHDAPIGVSPAVNGVFPNSDPKDPDADPPFQAIHPLADEWALFYWQSLNAAYGQAAELRFNGSYVIRYGDDGEGPSTDFSTRFSGREELVSLYAMAARQPDVLSEYLCLYRVLEAADQQNGKTSTTNLLPHLLRADFGELRVVGLDLRYDNAPNAFEIYRERAESELNRLAGVGIRDIPAHLYGLRNGLAHGKPGSADIITGSDNDGLWLAARALPILKLLARLAIDP